MWQRAPVRDRTLELIVTGGIIIIPFGQRQEFMNPPLKTLSHFMCKYSPIEGSWGLHNKAYTLFLTAVKHLSNRAAFPSSSRHFRQCFASPRLHRSREKLADKCIISGRGTGKRMPTQQRGRGPDNPWACFISRLEMIEEAAFRILLFWLQRSIENLFLMSRDRCDAT